MATARDTEFALAAVEQRLVSAEEVQECLAEMKRAKSGGASATLHGLLVKKGLVSQRQADDLLHVLAQKQFPKHIGGFEIIEAVGKGGMHTVYRARQVSMDRIVALKILSPKVADNETYVGRLFKEARAVAKLSHPNIIQGIDVGEDSGYYYFAAEFVDGESLADRLNGGQRLGEAEALKIAEQVCLALAHIQQHASMIHGDIKPANIMLTRDGTAKLADLGLARAIGGSERISAGSPHYISPEQARNSPDVDVRSDIYSLGATLFHMITGSPPYTGSDAKAVVREHISAPVPAVRIPGAQPSAGISKLITTMLAKDPAERYQTPDELLDDIRRIRKGLMPANMSISARPTAARLASEPRRSPVPVIALILIVLAGVAGVVALSMRKPQERVVAANDKNDHAAIKDDETAKPPVPNTQGPAARAFASAAAFEKAHPEKLEEIVSRYARVSVRYEDTAWGEKARQQGEVAYTRRQSRAATEFRGLKNKADALAAKERYAEAVAVFGDYPKKLAFGKWPESIKAEQQEHRSEAMRRAKELIEKAGVLAKEQRYDEAKGHLRTVLGFGFEETARQIRTRIAEYDRAVEDARREQAKRVEQEYERLEILVAGRERDRKYDLALRGCESFLEKHKGVPAQQRERLNRDVQELKDEITAARSAWEDVREALREQKGRTARIRVSGILLTGTIRDVTDTAFTIDTNENSMTKQLSEIHSENLLQLAGIAGNGQRAVIRRMRFFLAGGDIRQAEQAVALLNDEALVETWTARIRRRAEIVRALDREREARDKLAELKACVEKEQWKEACTRSFEFRRDYAVTPPRSGRRKTSSHGSLPTSSPACARSFAWNITPRASSSPCSRLSRTF